MVALLYWKEIIIALLVISGLCLINKNQDLRYEIKEVQLIHEKLVAEQKQRNADIVATYNRQRQLEAEQYAKELSIINGKYADLAASGSRMQLEVKAYTDRLHTVSREAVENYAKAAGQVYSECRSEYIKMGQYAAKLDAELDSKTKAP